jgi:predicted AAA+ superfamily ATPase
MIDRTLRAKIQSVKEKFPILTLTGPRQSGKTTLLKTIYHDYPYVSLEDLDNRQLAKQDPRAFLANYPNGAVIDEIQNVPELFSYLQTVVDSKEIHFALSGSQNFLLLEKITQTLAGRTIILKLLPLSISEIQQKHHIRHWEELAFQGFYPRIYHKNIAPVDFYPSYINTYVERDVRSLKNIGDLVTFTNFLKLCAGRIGQILNVQSLATDAGISPNTAKSWLSILETGYIVHFVQPHHNNLGKRIIKSPKLYFYDTGLACSLLGIENADQLRSHYLKGGLFENMVVNEFLKSRFNEGKASNIYFWQSKDRKEIDLVTDNQEIYEIKTSQTRQPHLFDNLLYWQKLNPSSTNTPTVIYGGDENQITSQGLFLSWRNLGDSFNGHNR